MKLFINILIFFFFFLILIHAIISLYHIITTFAPDFSIYYGSARDVIHQQNPYTDKQLYTLFAYPPVSMFFYIPFILLPYQIAQAIYILLSFLGLSASIIFSLKILNKLSWRTFLLVFSFAFLSFPVKFTLGMGQSNIIALFFLLISFYLYEKNRNMKSGILLGIAIILKPILIFFLLFYLLKRSWKIIFFASLIIFIAQICVSLFYHGLLFDYYLTKVLPHLFTTAGREVYYNQGLLGFISRLTTNLQMRSLLATIFEIIILLITVLFIHKEKDSKRGFAIFCVMVPLIDSLSWQHHFVLLLFPTVFLVFELMRKHNIRLFFILFFAYVLISLNIKFPKQFVHFPYPLLLSHTFYGALILWVILVWKYLKHNLDSKVNAGKSRKKG